MNYQEVINGRICVAWDPTWYTVQLLRTEAQLVHFHVKSQTGNMDCLLTVIYGYNTIEQRTTLWENLKEVAQGINIPWVSKKEPKENRLTR